MITTKQPERGVRAWLTDALGMLSFRRKEGGQEGIRKEQQNFWLVYSGTGTNRGAGGGVLVKRDSSTLAGGFFVQLLSVNRDGEAVIQIDTKQYRVRPGMPFDFETYPGYTYNGTLGPCS
ncbi:MAG: hypothetical protein V1492_04130 [Candidatus Micrarchaeota archaeon]